MGTRCNVQVSYGANRVMLYRHWDGYLAETGADLVERLKAAKGKPDAFYYNVGERFLFDLITAKRGGDGHDADRPQYELTNDVHGDIEYFYSIRFTNAGSLRIFVAKRPSGCPPVEEWIDKRSSYTLEQFVAAVNQDRKETNARIAQLRSSSKAYADCDDYPMLEAA